MSTGLLSRAESKQWEGAPSDKSKCDGTEITPVEAVMDLRVHQEHILRAEVPTSRPDGHRAMLSICDFCGCRPSSVDVDICITPAHVCARQGTYGFDQQHAGREVLALGSE
ncbi:hypothetical protein ABENE_17565 [Asticcacaulis benevestitus DSM 16100 = ATCC BAA-896]|uniref:Uncharacterized protein n=1 Tax=Asticcacaulis benevestitus DSM 16100 = ATCC BAA-896 TaxID=1121022 RepID=V4NZ41_9CAUL|nr:hypothetical protein ABENE_17565 [Asticcacaulis benevestitus DSM 16100 = ATCC BAA-896]